MSAFSPVAITHYGSLRRDQLLLVAPHAADAEPFLSSLPEVMEACPASPELLSRYLTVEQDFGSRELAHAIARRVSAADPTLGVTILESRLPRGIVDTGRLWPQAQRNVLSPTADPEVRAMLQRLHTRALEQLWAVFEALDPLLGFVIDVHTMSPFSPALPQASSSEALVEQPMALGHYLSAWTDPALRGGRRTVDLITDSEGVTLADPSLIRAIAKSCLDSGIAIQFNRPYSSGPHLVGAELMHRRRGLVIDVPKDYLTTVSAEDPSFDLQALELSTERTEHAANALARAIHLARLAQGDGPTSNRVDQTDLTSNNFT